MVWAVLDHLLGGKGRYSTVTRGALVDALKAWNAWPATDGNAVLSKVLETLQSQQRISIGMGNGTVYYLL